MNDCVDMNDSLCPWLCSVPPGETYMEALGSPEFALPGLSFNFSGIETEKHSLDLTEELTDFCWCLELALLWPRHVQGHCQRWGIDKVTLRS